MPLRHLQTVERRRQSQHRSQRESTQPCCTTRGSCVDPLYMSFFLSLCLSAEAARNKSQPTPHHSGDSTVLPCTRQRAGGSNLAQLQRRGAQQSLTQHQQRRPPRLRFLRLAAPSFRLSAAWSSVDDGFPKSRALCRLPGCGAAGLLTTGVDCIFVSVQTTPCNLISCLLQSFASFCLGRTRERIVASQTGGSALVKTRFSRILGVS